MDIKDYQFAVGDEVITTEGVKGKITSVCRCERCEERGFYEPFWTVDGSDYDHCIDIYDAKSGFSGFYKIGKYRFRDFNKDEVLREMASYEDGLKQLRKQLRLIEEYEVQYGDN
jgi:hypothetical protein